MTARARSLLTLLGAAVVALGLGLYAWFGVMRGEEQETTRKESAERLVAPLTQPDGGTAPVQFVRVAVIAKGDTTELSRSEDGTWSLERPVRAAADGPAVGDLVSAVENLRLKSAVEEAPSKEDLSRYGLLDPKFRVTATPRSGPAVTLLGGLENSFDGSTYVQRGGEKRVYTIDGSTRTSLDKGTFDLRDKQVLAVRDLGLTRIQMKTPKRAWLLERTEGKPWAFTQPKAEPADGGAISGWLLSLPQQRAEKFLADGPAERSRTGVEKPVVDATFRRAGESIRLRLAAGPKESDPSYLLREDGRGTVLAQLPRAALAALDKSPAELRDRTVLAFRPEQAQRVRFIPEGGGAALVVERVAPAADAGTPEVWRVTAPVSGPAQGTKIGSVLYALSALRAEPMETALPKDLAKTGLGPKARAVLLEGSGGKVLARLAVGRGVPKHGEWVYASGSRGETLALDKSRLKELPTVAKDVLEPPAVAPDAGQ